MIFLSLNIKNAMCQLIEIAQRESDITVTSRYEFIDGVEQKQDIPNLEPVTTSNAFVSFDQLVHLAELISGDDQITFGVEVRTDEWWYCLEVEFGNLRINSAAAGPLLDAIREQFIAAVWPEIRIAMMIAIDDGE